MTAGVLLTGGASRRMGLDKATLVVDGETFAQRAARVLTAACDPVIEVGSGVTVLPCAREEPLEIRVHGPGETPAPLVVTMRTPGTDFELAAGFCLTESVLDRLEDLDNIAYCLGGDGEQLYNVVTVKSRAPVTEDVASRRFLANSSCGICGKAALDEVAVRCAPIGPGPTVAASVVGALPETLAHHQRVFDETGGLH